MKSKPVVLMLLALLILPAIGYADVIPVSPISPIASFMGAVAITIILELMVAALFLSVTKISKNILIAVLIANLISLPVVWFAFPLLGQTLLIVALSEIFAIVLEAGIIFFMNKKAISMKQSLILSAIMNLVSFFVGGFVFAAMLDLYLLSVR